MESAAKKKNSLAMGVIGTMIVWASALLFSSAANASSASHVGQKSRAEVSGPFTAKTVAHLDANPINATRYYDALEGVALECTVAPVKTVLRYKLGPNDLDWRGLGKTVDNAIEEAFKRTGQKRSDFEVVQWGKDKYGKSVPVKWRGPNKTEVNIDWPHYGVDRHGNWISGPDAPHVGWQLGKGSLKKVGHIILDDVPYNR